MYDVEIRLDGEQHHVAVEDGETVLAAAEREGVELPSSCRAGACTACVARLLTGEVDQSKATGIDPLQREEGYILPCVAEPEADCSIQAGVQEELFELP